MKVIESIWFTSNETIGIVICETEIGERKAYIKKANGHNQSADEKHIMEHGSRFTADDAERILKYLTEF